MMCKRCGKKQATMYYKQTLNGKTKEYALCDDCAEELKNNGELDIKIPSFFGESENHFFGDFFGLGGLLGNLEPEISAKPKREKKKCSLCANTFDDLVNNGKVGCSKCYETFSEELKRTIENIHGNEKHIGRVPKKFKKEKSVKDKINDLRIELKNAIKKQEFEQAAVLRDEIKKLEEQG